MAEHGDTWLKLIDDAFTDYVHWRRNYYAKDPIVVSRARRRAYAAFLDEVTHRLDGLVKDLKADFPVHHPRYLGHMVSEQTLPAVLGYLATMLYNPNNVTEELAPVTLQLELEVGEMIAEMLGYSRDDAWAHITSGGTAANIEALWVARTIQFVPLALRELCQSVAPTFLVALPDGKRKQLRGLTDLEALHLCPDDAISMPRRLAAFLWEEGRIREERKITKLAREAESDKNAKLTNEELQERVSDELGEDVEVSGAAVAELVEGLFRGTDVSRKPVARLIGELKREKRAMVKVKEGPGYQAARLLRAAELIDEYLAKSRWNPAWAGHHKVASVSDQPLRPLVFAAETAHYSVKKACDVLGYGGNALRSVPVDSGFRIRTGELEVMIEDGLKKGGYVAAVLGIVGSTEVGAVDPVHELLNLRIKFATEKARCFWIHVDAAWGGYIASVFRGSPAIPARRLVEFKVGGRSRRRMTSWGERDEINAAFSDEDGLAQVDSITVDPHKLGYIPYPAGAVAFRNRGVTDIVAHKANYIAEWGSGGQATRAVSRRRINELGAHILEGSKPGAAAAACWLAHSAIPLNSDGHGKIVLSTLLNAQRLACYLELHAGLFSAFDSDLEDELREEHRGVLPAGFRSPPPKPFTFVVLGDVDTNVVCYVARQMQLAGRRLSRRKPPTPLAAINKLNKDIYERLGKVSGAEYFLSRTILDERYSTDVRERALRTIGVDPKDPKNNRELKNNGLFVLRSTVMNPHYDLARDEADKDYLLDFVRHLHRVTRELI